MRIIGERGRTLSPKEVAAGEKVLTGPAKVDKRDLTVRQTPDGRIAEYIICRSAQTEARTLFNPDVLRKKKIVPLNDVPGILRRKIKGILPVEADWMCDCL